MLTGQTRRNVMLGGGAAATVLAMNQHASADGVKWLSRRKRYSLSPAGRVSIERLNSEVEKAFPLFNKPSILPDFDVVTHGAKCDVEVRRITTATIDPRTGEKIPVTGLLATPVGARGRIPVVSWQHGTILSFDQVPSNLVRLQDENYSLSDDVDSLETLFNLHRFAAHGFAVIAADYVGKGPLRHGRGEGYAVREITTSTCRDVLSAGLAALRARGMSPTKLFLHGWSQGALNTQWLHQSLRGNGVAIAGTAVSSPFNDLSEALRFWTGRQGFALPAGVKSYPEVPNWVALCLIILLGSYELHYGIDGLLQSAIRPQYRELATKYWRDYNYEAASSNSSLSAKSILVPGFFDGYTADSNSAFLRRLANNCASYWRYDSPIRFCYGLADEAIHPEMVARALSAGGNLAQGVAVANASHRGTFLAALYGDEQSLAGKNNIPAWFQSSI